MPERDCYVILQISNTASINEIKKAFRSRAKQLHPDHGGDARSFAELKTAFEQAILVASKISQVQPEPFSQAQNRTAYDPFSDKEYENYIFFEPKQDKIADFERSIYAANCKYCGGVGKMNKLVHPERGFFGREERFCICQKVGIRET